MSLMNPFPLVPFGSGVELAREPVPSGQQVDLFEVLIDEIAGEAWLRFRFLAPGIGKADGGVSYAQVEADFAHLCDTVALPYLTQFALEADVLVISLLDRPVDFGQSDPQATQYIEAFRVETGSCEWEGDW